MPPLCLFSCGKKTEKAAGDAKPAVALAAAGE